MSTEERFLAAVNVINSLPKNGAFQLSLDLMLKFNAYYKQATDGPCKSQSLFHTHKIEWSSWQSLGEMTKLEAMEKYVEELLKIIETMSYTKVVSDFMKVMGPIYEAVSIDDIENNINRSRHTHFPKSNEQQNETTADSQSEVNCEINKEDADSISLPMCSVQDDGFVHIERISYSHFKSTEETDSIQVSVLNSSHSMELIESENMTLPHHCNAVKNEVLSTSIANLQKSLDGIVCHLAVLEDLAKQYKNQMQEGSSISPSFKKWRWKPFTICFFLFWPFLVNWLINVRKRSRNLM